jgi:hypothetical protein
MKGDRNSDWFLLMSTTVLICSFILLSSAGHAFAAIPFITDDTGTQGRGKFQFEFFGEYGHDSDARIAAKTTDLSATLTYGVIDPIEIIVSVPYQAWRTDDSGSVAKGDGIGDIAMEAKWRFYEREGLSLALKPGFTVPTGDEEKGLGAGRATYFLFFIASKEISPWSINVNLACIRNENTIDERRDIWHASIDALFEVMKDLKLGLDIGVETNPDSSSNTPPAYILGGLIWSLRENLDIGLGVKGGFTKPETDVSVRGGITWRF